jgi:hypothetical protein
MRYAATPGEDEMRDGATIRVHSTTPPPPTAATKGIGENHFHQEENQWMEAVERPAVLRVVVATTTTTSRGRIRNG